MKLNFEKNVGITLIALVVTIIIILVLAGISVNMLTGQNGILNRATDAKRNTEDSSDLEYLQTQAYEGVTDYYLEENNGSETEYILEKLGKLNGVTTNIAQGTVTYKGKVYDISKIAGNSNEKKAIENQEGLSQITAANAISEEDKNILAETDDNGNAKVRMIIVEETTKDKTIKAVIPSGFYYVTGKITEGLVISDKFGDDDNNSKGGNQFVWVPCNGGEAIYQKHMYETAKVDDTDASIVDTEKGNWTTYQYRNYDNWEDNRKQEEKEKSVKKYGGFYIARYEAGEPINADFYSNKDGSTYWQSEYDIDTDKIYGADNTNKQDTSKTYKNTYKYKNKTTQNGEDLLPLSKKNVLVWNYIDQINSIIASENMYKQSRTVASYLVDSYAWDTVTQWIADKGINITDSITWGNYKDSQYSLKGLYAKHQQKKCNDGKERMFPAYICNYGIYDKQSEEYLEIATGTSDRNKVQNIYDLAGNMWEWTTETRKNDISDSQSYENGVLRGGSFINYGYIHAVNYRYGGTQIGGYYMHVGFRVVLYIL